MNHIWNFQSNDANANAHKYKFILGHLYVETALSQVISRTVYKKEKIFKVVNGFHKKILYLESLNRLNSGLIDLLKEINKIRNQLAHDIDSDIARNQIISLMKDRDNDLVYYSDQNIYDYLSGEDRYFEDVELIEELLSGTYFAVFQQNKDLFSEDEIKKFYQLY